MFGIATIAMGVALAAGSAIPVEPRPEPKPVAAPAPATDATRYCVVFTATGSHIRQRICRTRSDWLSRGTDPLAAE